MIDVPNEPTLERGFLQKLHGGEYTSKLTQPGAYDFDEAARAAYDDDCKRLEALLKNDLFSECGVAGHPKAQMCLDIAIRLSRDGTPAGIAHTFALLTTLLK